MLSRSCLATLLVLLVFFAGCDGVNFGRPKKVVETKQKGSRWQKGSEAAARQKAKAQADVDTDAPRRKVAKAVPLEGATIRASSFEGGRSSSSSLYSGAPRSESQAIDEIGKTLRESLDLGPTVVVWVLDRSESSARLVTSAASAINGLYSSDDLATAAKEEKLLTAVVGFGEKSDFLLDPPAGDPAQVKAALAAIKTEPGSREGTFAALKLALEKYLPLRTKERREVVIALVTDEPGDDRTVLDDVVAIAQKNAIGVFVVGPSAPLGKAAVAAAGPNTPAAPAGGDARTLSADSYFPDWVTFDVGQYATPEMYDSGLGPWPLERLARETSGAYYPVGSPSGSSVDPAVMSKYAPDYLSVSEVEKSLAENKCRQALVDAAKLPPVKASLMNPQTIFPKRNEAEMARLLLAAQREPAKLEEGVNKLYAALAGADGSIESDRAKLTGTRWQVAYDTALGRAAAAKVRIEGYNAMIAALKRGKTFANEGSTTWVLEPADTIETGSTYQRLADKAKTYLEGVVKDHPNTPWARLAEEELRTPLGWTWKEQ